jgi:hypothetical protein
MAQHTCESLPCRYVIKADVCGATPCPKYRRTNGTPACGYAKKRTSAPPETCAVCAYHQGGTLEQCGFRPEAVQRSSDAPACMYFKKR